VTNSALDKAAWHLAAVLVDHDFMVKNVEAENNLPYSCTTLTMSKNVWVRVSSHGYQVVMITKKSGGNNFQFYIHTNSLTQLMSDLKGALEIK
jgi:hypothetical protein